MTKTSYIVELSFESGFRFETVAETNTTTTRIYGLLFSRDYYVRVTAQNAAGNSDPSTETHFVFGCKSFSVFLYSCSVLNISIDAPDTPAAFNVTSRDTLFNESVHLVSVGLQWAQPGNSGPYAITYLFNI